MKINKIILIVSAILLSSAGLVLFSMHKAHVHPRIELPAPTGPFAVGTTAYHLIDKSRKEILSHNPEDYRELMIQVWYPADANPSSHKATPDGPAEEFYPYLSQEMPYVKETISGYYELPLEQLCHLDKPIKTHSIYNAPVSSLQNQYPILLFSHGLGTCIGRLNTCILEDLASHGYIVVAIDHTYDNLVTFFPGSKVIKPQDAKRIFPEGVTEEEKQKGFEQALEKNIHLWVGDMQFVLNELEKFNRQDPTHLLTSKLNISRVGAFGHSYGGFAAAQMCRLDKRCKAGIDIDGAVWGKDAQKPFDRPFMFLLAEKSFELSNFSAEKLEKMHATKADIDKHITSNRESLENLFNNLTNDAYFIFLKKADHMSFTDYNLLYPAGLEPDVIAPLKGIEITRKLVVGFFDVYLKNKDRAQFIQMMEQMPEVTEKIKIRK